jgi:Lysyl oxidase
VLQLTQGGGSLRERRRAASRRALRGGAASLALAALFIFAGVASSAAAADRLPDLGMARLSDLRVDKSSGRDLLRYTTVIANVGAGPFELRGQRSSTADAQMSVQQRIYDDAGGSRLVPTSATMYFAGDGHTHWHVRDLETEELIRLDNGAKVGTSAKHGFCFFDNTRYRLTLPGAPQSAVYTGCGTASNLAVTMGLSVGWGDAYYWSLPDQYVDITGLGSGRYRLLVTADAANWFAESNNSNNATWVDLQLKGNAKPRVIGYGPAA